MSAITKTLLMVALTTLLTISNSVDAMNSVCQRTSDKALCSEITKGALTWSEAMNNSINYELDYVKAGKSIIDGVGSKLRSNIDPELKQTIIANCRKNYEDVVEHLNLCLRLVKRGDPNRSLSVVIGYQNFDFCTIEFIQNQIPVPSRLANYAGEFSKTNDVLLGLARSRPNA